MGSCCSCPDKDSIPDNHQSKFKVINVDDDGNELGSGVMELTEEELILHTRKRHAVRWPYLCLRRYGYDSNLFSFESGRRCQTGQGIFAFKCARAEEIFNMLQDIMHNNSISVVEEPVLEPSQTPADAAAAATDIPRTPRTPTTPGYSVPTMPNGIGRYPSFGDASSRPSSRHPSVGSARLPSVGEESTHPLLVSDETVHTYVNTSGVQEDRRSRSSVHAPLDLRLSNPESLVPPSPNEASEGHVLLEPEGVKFVLGPTPVQRQLMAKERRRDSSESGGEAVASADAEPAGTPPPVPPHPPSSTGALNGCSAAAAVAPSSGLSLDCDTGYDSDERKETPSASSAASSSATTGAKASAYEHHNGTAAAPNPAPAAPVPPADRPAPPTPAPVPTATATTTVSTGARRCRPPIPTPDAQNANNSAQRRTALLNYENLPALPPVWETRKPHPEADEEEEEENNAYAPKTPSLNNGYHHHHQHQHHHHHHHHHHPQHTPHPLLLHHHHHGGLDPLHNYVNTENVTVPLSAHKPDSARPPRRDCAASQQPSVFNFDFRRGGAGSGGASGMLPATLNYIEVEMEKGSDSSGPHTPKTPTTPLPQTPTRRTELYAVIDIERTAAMSSLQKALPRDDGTSRKTRHNSTDLPM
ncbi:fibroblast growth factor receptor substrate 2a [Sardina pilchardus]|uniref:fibroblast growth factor receptor substrate 2a n=1 Tax=Sardina pilchardus TaxID=27697 RepID=UPI002E1380F1